MRGDRARVIVEEFIDFDYEITLLTVTQRAGDTLYCDPIGHVQERGDYQFSWQPAECSDAAISEAQHMANIITAELGGAGLFGVEFFVTKAGEVIFSELSPRPHDTGMVTLYTQALTEFDLHARAFLGLSIPQVDLVRPGASHVILAPKDAIGPYHVSGLADAVAVTMGPTAALKCTVGSTYLANVRFDMPKRMVSKKYKLNMPQYIWILKQNC